MKNIKLEDRLIFALDVPEVSDAKEIVTELDDSVNFYKIGMEMLMTGQYFELLDWLIKKDKKSFC
jgi:orotidine-5'-phosphate decarboxylase